MALVWADRVLETTTTIGTGALTLAGTVAGYQTFAVVGDGNTCYYCVYAVDGSGNPSGVWEVGLGTYTASGTTLARTAVYANSSGTQVALDLAAGTKRVMLTAAAQHLTTIPVVNGGTGLTALGSALQVLRVNAGGTALEYGTISTGLTVGTTAIASGTSGRLLYDNGGTLGETAAVTYSTSTPNLTVTASGAAVVPFVVKGATSQTANLTEWQDSAGTVGARVDASRNFSRPGSGAGSESFGAGATTGATTGGTAIGAGAAVSDLQGTAVGANSAADYQAVAIGAYSSAGYKSVALGAHITTAGVNFAQAVGNNINMRTAGRCAFGIDLDIDLTSNAFGSSFTSTGYNQTFLGDGGSFTVPADNFGCFMGASRDAGNGYFLNLHGRSSTAGRSLFRLAGSWVDSTDATRKARATLNAYDTAARECIRLEASGSAAMLGLYGTAAVVQYATTGTVTGYTGGGGTALTHSDTFTGNTGATAYTLGDIVRALKLLGVIAA